MVELVQRCEIWAPGSGKQKVASGSSLGDEIERKKRSSPSDGRIFIFRIAQRNDPFWLQTSSYLLLESAASLSKSLVSKLIHPVTSSAQRASEFFFRKEGDSIEASKNQVGAQQEEVNVVTRRLPRYLYFR